jgi:type IV pilus assembly protein PilQ
MKESFGQRLRRGGGWAFIILLPSLLAPAVFLPTVCGAAQAVLEAVETNPLPGGRLQIRFRLSQPPQATPETFTINDPARIVLDFPNTRTGVRDRQQTIGLGVAEKVSVLQGGDRTRAAVNLARLVPYQVATEGNVVVLTLESGTARSARTGPVATTRGAVRSVGGLDFRRSPEGSGVVTLRLSDPAIAPNAREEGNRIVIDFPNAALPAAQQRRLDVGDFATPVARVDALNQAGGARVVIEPIPPYEFLAYQANDLYTVEVKKPVPRQDDEGLPIDFRQKTFRGDLLSLNFQDIEVRAVLQIIADFTGQNIVVSDTVQGNLTLRLQNVPWDQALDIILLTKGLALRQNGNVIYIAPTEEVATREKLELEARKTTSELIPLRTELIQVNYAKASDLATLLKSTAATAGKTGTTGGTTDTSTLLSARGQVTVDPRTNSLLVQDIPEKITEIRNLVTRLDRPVRQVMIDSRVVIANDNFNKELGIRWGFTGVRKNGDDGIISTTGNLEGTSTMVDSAVNNLTTTGSPYPVTVPALANRLGVRLGTASDPYGRLAVAILGSDYLVDLELSALQAEGRGEILSNPRVVTTDRSKASILQGREIPYQTVSDEGTETEFKEALLRLDVTPQITPDDRIIMDLLVKKDDQGQNVGSATGAQIPSIDRREVQTQVLVDDGQTVVLGGVFEQNKTQSTDKVPLLGDIPVVGKLFQRNANSDVKRELLIFVTPQILRGEVATINR